MVGPTTATLGSRFTDQPMPLMESVPMTSPATPDVASPRTTAIPTVAAATATYGRSERVADDETCRWAHTATRTSPATTKTGVTTS